MKLTTVDDIKRTYRMCIAKNTEPFVGRKIGPELMDELMYTLQLALHAQYEHNLKYMDFNSLSTPTPKVVGVELNWFNGDLTVKLDEYTTHRLGLPPDGNIMVNWIWDVSYAKS